MKNISKDYYLKAPWGCCTWGIEVHHARGTQILCSVTTQGDRMGWEVRKGFKREETSVYLWLLIHVDVQQKPTQYWKAIILQFKRSKNFKTPSWRKSSPSPVHIPHLGSCILSYKTQDTKCTLHVPFKSPVTQRNDISVSTPSECSPHWAEITCLRICLALEPGCLWKAESWGLAQVCTFISSTWLHLHCMCTDGTKSSHVRKCSELPKRAFSTSRLHGGVAVTKRSPHCLYPTWTAVT